MPDRSALPELCSSTGISSSQACAHEWAAAASDAFPAASICSIAAAAQPQA